MPKMMHIAAFLMVLRSLSFISFFVSEAHAQDCIDLIGSRWSKSDVGVYIASGTNDVQREQVLFALAVWWGAQNWFIDSFEHGAGMPWLLYLTDRSDEATISVSFFIGQGVDFGGRAITEGSGGGFTKVQVQINLPPDRAGNPDDLYVESVILHELGHAMGLGHTQIEGDAMNGAGDASPRNYGLPSTLDLYALYQLSQSQQVAELSGAVCLQSDIGYGLPPWVENKPDGTVVLSFPMPGFSVSWEAPIGCPTSIDMGGSGEIKTAVRNNGRYPLEVISETAKPDWELIEFLPNEYEQLPLVVEPNSQVVLTHPIRIVSGIVSIGTHTVTIRTKVVPLTLEGWSSETSSINQTISFEVTEPQALVNKSRSHSRRE